MRTNRLVWCTYGFLFFAIAAVALRSWTGAPPTKQTLHRSSPTVSSASTTPAALSLASLPLMFEQNQGQTDAQVQFTGRSNGMVLFLTSSGYVLKLCGSDPAGETAACGTVRMSLLGAGPEPKAMGMERLPGVSNYIIGNDREDWRTGIPQFGRVRYQSVYPGIDLVYYGNQGRLEYDFIVSPGADPSSIELGYSSAEGLSLDEGGNLLTANPVGQIIQHAPVVYQESNAGRKHVEGGYVLLENDHVEFEIGAYDPSLPLIIDPVLVFSTFLGGSGDDRSHDVAVDADGNIYVVGRSQSADFPTRDAYDTQLTGTGDAFLTKLTPGGEDVVFSTYLGGENSETAEGVGVDRNDNIYLFGDTGSTDFPTYAAIQKVDPGAGGDCFVTKLDPSGATLLYSTYLGGGGSDYASDIAVLPSGESFLLGDTYSTNFPTHSPLFGTNSGGRDLFITSLPPSGLYYYYSTYLGGSGLDEAGGIAADSSSNAYITGRTESTDFSTANAAQPLHGGGAADGIVARLRTLALFLDYSTYLGGSNDDILSDMWVDGDQNAYAVGRTYSADFPTKNALQPDSAGALDVGIARFASDGSMDFSTFLGGSGSDEGWAIEVDRTGFIHVAGVTTSDDFPTVHPFQGQHTALNDVFVAQLTPMARALVDSTYIGGSLNEIVSGLAVDARGVTYVAGSTWSTDFPTSGALQPSHGGGNWDVFVLAVKKPLDFFIAATPPASRAVAVDQVP